MPKVDEHFTASPAVVPMQLLVYKIVMFIMLLIQFGSLKQVGMVFVSVHFGVIAVVLR